MSILNNGLKNPEQDANRKTLEGMEVVRGKNYDVREEIKAYWSRRAATFDLSPWHEIFSNEERQAWLDFIRCNLGAGEGRTALDLACGTGVISHLMDDLGFAVTGLDWSCSMLELARAKAKKRGRSINFLIGDAENTMEADASFDVIINRHLVWTLINPQACFAEWLRVLKPGGRLLVIDGCFFNIYWHERLARKISDFMQKIRTKKEVGSSFSKFMDEYKDIRPQLPFPNGASAGVLADMLGQAGFMPVIVDKKIRNVYRKKAKNIGRLEGLLYSARHRYAIMARKPVRISPSG